MSTVSSHVLDTSIGRPASGVDLQLERQQADGTFSRVARGTTNDDGRLARWTPEAELPEGTYRLSFDTAGYFHERSISAFYPSVQVIFRIEEPGGHYHIPLLLSPWGYSTYRGS